MTIETGAVILSCVWVVGLCTILTVAMIIGYLADKHDIFYRNKQRRETKRERRRRFKLEKLERRARMERSQDKI